MSAPKPDTSEMVNVHQALRDALGAAPVLVGGIDPADADRTALIADYYENVLAFLAVHHHGEELLMFPLLRDRCPGQEGAIDRVSAQHHDVDGGVAEATELLAAWPQDKGTEIQQRLGRSLQELGTTLATHLEEEEREMLPLCADHLSMEEWGALPAHAMANFTGNKHWLILGLVFEQMTAQQRQDILEHMPPPPREMWTSMGADAFASLIAEVRAPLA
jgi:hemerythrin-like domain-containing protein